MEENKFSHMHTSYFKLALYLLQDIVKYICFRRL